VAGPLRANPALKEALIAYAEWQRAPVVDIISDEDGKAGSTDRQIDGLARRIADASAVEIKRPVSFLGHAGMKVFRDDVFANLRLVFRADHRAYRREAVYDFPQRSLLKMALIRLAYLITGIPFIQRRMMKDFRKVMVMPYRKFIDEARHQRRAAG
jgi:hypothetical protein